MDKKLEFELDLMMYDKPIMIIFRDKLCIFNEIYLCIINQERYLNCYKNLKGLYNTYMEILRHTK